MTYQVRTTKKFDKSFKKLDRQSQKLIKKWMAILLVVKTQDFMAKP